MRGYNIAMKFKYCPECGERLDGKELGDEGDVPYCTSCGKPWFDMFSTCIIALVVNEMGEAVLLKQKYISEKYFNLISGYMKPGETAESAAVREIEEETGIKPESIELIGTYWSAKEDMLMIGFIARAEKKAFVLSCEVDGAEWRAAEEAIKTVHPKGSVSHTLLEEYLKRSKK